MSAIMLLTCFTIASAEFIAERSGGDPLGCPYKHVEFVNHAMNSSTFHTWEYVCPQTPGYNVSVVGQFAHCWVDKGVLTNNANVLPIPCCNVLSFTKHLPLCAPTAKNYHTCRNLEKCPVGTTKLEGEESRYIGISDVKYCSECGAHRHYIPYELCCRKILSMCEAGDHRQPEECMCGNSFPHARCFSSQICKPDGNGKCETGEFEEYVQAVNGGSTVSTVSTMSTYVIAAIVVGALVLIALLTGSFIWCFTRKAKGAAAATSQEQQLEAI